MPPERLAGIARSISRWLGPIMIQIAGGEPLISPNAKALMVECARLHMPMTVTTNGLHLDDHWARLLTGWKVRYVNISLDGFSELHDRIRGVPDAYKRALEAATRLAGRGIVKPRVTCVIMKENLDQIVEFTKHVCETHFDGIFFQAMAQPFGQAPRPHWWRDHPLWPDDLDHVGSVIGKLIQLKKMGYPILNRHEQFEAMRAYYTNPEHFCLADCTVGEHGLTIDPDGAVRLCPRHSAIGSALNADLKDIWFSKSADESRRIMRNCQTNCHLLINCVFDEDQLLTTTRPMP
jgi:MoaA/NifB/PqqE/SkfB family radical SAM enzyme